jgi:hypothetical protein
MAQGFDVLLYNVVYNSIISSNRSWHNNNKVKYSLFSYHIFTKVAVKDLKEGHL